MLHKFGIEMKLERANVRMSREDILESDDGPPEVRRAKALFRDFYEALSDVDVRRQTGKNRKPPNYASPLLVPKVDPSAAIPSPPAKQ